MDFPVVVKEIISFTCTTSTLQHGFSCILQVSNYYMIQFCFFLLLTGFLSTNVLHMDLSFTLRLWLSILYKWFIQIPICIPPCAVSTFLLHYFSCPFNNFPVFIITLINIMYAVYFHGISNFSGLKYATICTHILSLWILSIKLSIWTIISHSMLMDLNTPILMPSN